MAKKASAKADSGGKKVARRASSSSGGSGTNSRSRSQSEGAQSDMVDALIKLLQSPLVIDLLAVGATAALAAITESRTSRTQGAMDTRGSKKVLKAAGKAAAAAVGRRIATEFDEIKAASKRAGEGRKATVDAEA
jgi:hypothetical protein